MIKQLIAKDSKLWFRCLPGYFLWAFDQKAIPRLRRLAFIIYLLQFLPMNLFRSIFRKTRPLLSDFGYRSGARGQLLTLAPLGLWIELRAWFDSLSWGRESYHGPFLVFLIPCWTNYSFLVTRATVLPLLIIRQTSFPAQMSCWSSLFGTTPSLMACQAALLAFQPQAPIVSGTGSSPITE